MEEIVVEARSRRAAVRGGEAEETEPEERHMLAAASWQMGEGVEAVAKSTTDAQFSEA